MASLADRGGARKRRATEGEWSHAGEAFRRQKGLVFAWDLLTNANASLPLRLLERATKVARAFELDVEASVFQEPVNLVEHEAAGRNSKRRSPFGLIFAALECGRRPRSDA